MTASRPDTDALLRAAERGDATAASQLLAQHRSQLRQMVAVHLDRRLAARVDPSDVVQEALAEAAAGLDRYLRERPLPFYPWLRQFAWQRLAQLHRHHVGTQRRSVDREAPSPGPTADRSAAALVDRLIASGTSPSRRLMREESCRRVRACLDRLAPRDREVLLMRYLEEMSSAEVGAVLGLAEGAVRVRLVRALARLRAALDDE